MVTKVTKGFRIGGGPSLQAVVSEFGRNAEWTANSVQTNGFFGVKKGFRADVVDAGNPLCSWRGFRGQDRGALAPTGSHHLSSFVNFAPFKEMSAIRPFVSKTNPTTGSRTVVVLRSPPVPTSITATFALTPASQPWLSRNCFSACSVMKTMMMSWDWPPNVSP